MGPGAEAEVIEPSLITGAAVYFPGPKNELIPPTPTTSGFQSEGIFGYSTHLQLPYTLQWNLSAQQALGKSQALTVSYVGAHGDRLLEQEYFAPTANPYANSVYLVRNGLTSDYNSLQAQFQRSLAHGLSFLGSYTWSHCIDYGSDNVEIGYQRGNCDYDVRHNVSTAISYTLPNVSGDQAVKAVLNHWGIDDRFTARSAFPVFLPGNETFSPTTGQLLPSGMESVPGQPLYLSGAACNAYFTAVGSAYPVCPGGKAINPCAFYAVGGPANPPPCNQSPTLGGLAPRNQLRAFDAVQMDLAVRREFSIYRELRLQFRAEAFNIFNHPNFGEIETVTGDQDFGQAIATLANSGATNLNPLYSMGGSRSMQFALKMIF
jgi:hypothetical protein